MPSHRSHWYLPLIDALPSQTILPSNNARHLFQSRGPTYDHERMVVLYHGHGIIVYWYAGGVPNSWEECSAVWKSWWVVRPKRHIIWCCERWIHSQLFQGIILYSSGLVQSETLARWRMVAANNRTYETSAYIHTEVTRRVRLEWGPTAPLCQLYHWTVLLMIQLVLVPPPHPP